MSAVVLLLDFRGWHSVCFRVLSSVNRLLQLVMRWFQYSIADFEETLNPENGSFVVMERKEKEDTVCMHRFGGAQNNGTQHGNAPV